MKTLVIAEHDNQILKAATLTTLAAAELLPAKITVLVAGNACEKVLAAIKQNEKIEKIILVDSPVFKNFLAEDIAALVAKLAPAYDYVIAPATTFGKNTLPRAAALCDSSMISDVTKIINDNTFVRPIYAGNAFETIETTEKIKFLTIRPSAFSAKSLSGNEVAVEKSDLQISPQNHSRFVKHVLTELKRPELAGARIIVAGGRGLQNKENFRLIEQLADKLGAAIGASRAAVDAGFISNDFQVGQTGKIVAPELYIAIGISGAIQHLAGMKDSKIVVAINKDADAPIFQVADYGLVGDLFEIIPQLIAELERG